MTDEERDDLLARADDLNHRLEAVPFEQMLRQYTKQRSQLQMLLALVVALVLVVAVQIVVTTRVYRNSRDIATAQDIFVANCDAGNEFRAGERELWGFIFEAQPAAPRTPEQQKQLDEIRAIVDRIFAQRDCSELPSAPHP
jgi:hypothetical protein